MSKRELTRNILTVLYEIKEAEEQYSYTDRLICGPQGAFSAWPTGMPRGTNDPITALLQRVDVNEAIDKLEELYKKLSTLEDEQNNAA